MIHTSIEVNILNLDSFKWIAIIFKEGGDWGGGWALYTITLGDIHGWL